LHCRRRRRLALHARKLGGLGTREAVERMSDRHEPHGDTAVRLVACQPPQRSGSARPLSHANLGRHHLQLALQDDRRLLCVCMVRDSLRERRRAIFLDTHHGMTLGQLH
jgi:hypothetical protein